MYIYSISIFNSGAFSFAKIREQRDKCGSYIIRQCEKEYDTYYIDINTKS